MKDNLDKIFCEDITIIAEELKEFYEEVEGSTVLIAGGKGFQRPFELATLRLRNMIEVLNNWDIYVPRVEFLTQRGGTFLLGNDNELLYSYKAQGILCYSETMSAPLSFLEKCI